MEATLCASFDSNANVKYSPISVGAWKPRPFCYRPLLIPSSIVHLQYNCVGSPGIMRVLSVIALVVLQLRRWLGPSIVVVPMEPHP